MKISTQIKLGNEMIYFLVDRVLVEVMENK
jgi:hypothetical protein